MGGGGGGFGSGFGSYFVQVLEALIDLLADGGVGGCGIKMIFVVVEVDVEDSVCLMLSEASDCGIVLLRGVGG